MTRIETVVIAATDLVGSTEIASRIGSLKFEELRREHDSILGDDIEDAGGRVVKNTGDGVLAAFPSVTAAVAAAIAIQQHLERRARTTPVTMSVRIGISVGDASVEEGDYFGFPPIEATRLCARAAGGEIVVADPIRAMLRDRREHHFESLGALELKGLPEPIAAWRVRWNPLPDTDGASLPPRLRELPNTAYVGRIVEQGLLLASWDRAVDGRRQVVVISGEPGIGKTRLVGQTARTALPDHALILYGRCDEDQAMPYHPWLEILREYVRVAPRRVLRPHAGQLSRLVPELSQRIGGVPPPPSADPDTERYRLFTAVGAVLAAASELAPVLVILDDLHWADQPTLALFKYLVTASATGRLLLLGTYRDSDLVPDGPLAPVLADLRREAGATRIALDGLTAGDIVDLIEEMAGHPIDSDGRAFAAQVHRETAGNPFFVGEMIRHLRETGAIVLDANGRWSFASPDAGHGLPQGVREVIGRRLHRLSDDARHVLSAGAVIGSEFDLALLSRVASRPPADVLDRLDEAVAASLLIRAAADPDVKPGAVPAALYRFSHGLVQSTLYDSLAAGRRVAFHRTAALAIEEHHGDQADHLAELAHHFLESAPLGDTARAREYARRAGAQAMSQFAYDQAAALFARALAVAPSSRPTEQIALLQSLGEAQMRGGDSIAARRTLLEAAQGARRHDEPEALARATLACGIWGLSFGVDEVLVELAEEAILRLEGSSSRRLLAQVKGLLAAALYFAPAPHSERRHLLSAEAVALARETYESVGDRESAASLAYVLGRALLAGWGPESAEQDIENAELFDLCRALNHGELELLVRNWRTMAMLERGDFAELDRELARVEHMAGELRQPRAMVYLPLHRAMRSIAGGRFAEAERLNAESLEIGARLPKAGSELAATAQLLVIRLLQGRLPELEELLRELTRAQPGMVAVRCAFVVMLVQAGHHAEARAELETVLSGGLAAIPRDNTHIVSLALLGDAAAQLRDVRRARSLYEWLEPYRGRWVVSPSAAPLWPVDRSLGRLAGVGGAHDVALEHLAASRAAAEAVSAFPAIALTVLDEARLFADRGVPGDAARVVERSRQARLLAADLGMLLVVEEATSLETGAAGPVESYS